MRRPWLLAVPLVVLALGTVWFAVGDKGTAPIGSSGVPLKWEKGATVAIASSAIGFQLDLESGVERVYDSRHYPFPDEKILPVATRIMMESPPIVAVERTSSRIGWKYADGTTKSVSLNDEGRSLLETITPAPGKGMGPESVTTKPRLMAEGPPIPRPNVSITIDSDDPRDDRVVKALLDDLIVAVHPRLRRSIAPMGLTSDVYFGHVFWDADVWVFPALALLDPEAAAEIPKYRLSTLPQATKNFDEWVRKDRPTARGKIGAMPMGGSLLGAKFAWESSETGTETVPGPSQFEDHISGSVAWSVGRADDLGLVPAKDAARLRLRVGSFFGARSEKTARGLELWSTVSPDEHHTGDNDLYTNLLAQEVTGKPYYLPRDGKSFLSYDGDSERGYKQAAALLAVYPLQYPPAEKEAGVMLDRFAPKVIKNGPAMTDAIHSIVAARIGRADQGLQFWRKSWEGFYDLDRGMFSERRSGTRREYFYTGAAGTLQAVLYGFAGLRVDRAGGKGTLIAKLKNGKELRASPHLPKSWRSIKISGMTVLGKRSDLAVYADGRVDLRPAASK